MIDKKCENCIWFDKCHEGEACDDYEPSSIEEQEALDMEEYERDLSERHMVYMEQIKEQDM